MGAVSTSEDNEDRKTDAQFCDHEPVAELKALLVAAVEPRKFKRKSAPAPKLRKSKQQLAEEARYRKMREQHHARTVAQATEPELRAEIAQLRAENEELRTLLKMRISALEASN